MKYTTLINLTISILLLSLIKYSFEASEHLDMKILSSASSAGWILQKLNISEKHIPTLSPEAKLKVKKFINSRVERSVEQRKTQEEEKEEEEETTCSFDDQLIHSKVSAIINNARDPNNRGFGQETIYMYLSHYVDIPPAYLGGCKKNDESPYYANWITNDDRDVYDSFLRVLDGLNKMEDFRNLLNTVKDIKGKIDDFEEYFYENDFCGYVKKQLKDKAKDELKDFGYNYVLEGQSLSEYLEGKMDELTEYFENSESTGSPEDEAIKKITESISKKFITQESVESVLDAFGVVFEMAAGSFSLFTASITMVNLPLLFITTLGPKAAVAGMLYSLSGRLAGRVLRVIEEGGY